MQEKDISIAAEKANLLTLPFTLPALGMVLLYGLVHGFARLFEAGQSLAKPWIFLPIFLIGIVVHEIIHGLTWALFSPRGWKSIRFGFILKALMPYASCTDRLKINAYRLGGIMPGLSLGVVPFLAGLAADWPTAALIGAFFTLVACGDFWIVYALRREPRVALVLDHPKRVGCIVYYPDP